tara:strand:- start:180 stop:656 length:477 start_codon:yes stop_codon:yes gene_type:complete
MAHFAEIDSDNIVLRVIVIDNNDVNEAGGDYSLGAEEKVKSIVPFSTGIRWVQTSYNNNARKQYAGIGHTYDSTKNKFISPQPYPSWSLDNNDDWQAPITYPTITDDGADPVVWRYIISWNETKYNADNTTGWEATKSNDTSETPTKYNWNGTAWVSE